MISDFLDGLLLGWVVGCTGFVLFLFVWVGVMGRPLFLP